MDRKQLRQPSCSASVIRNRKTTAVRRLQREKCTIETWVTAFGWAKIISRPRPYSWNAGMFYVPTLVLFATITADDHDATERSAEPVCLFVWFPVSSHVLSPWSDNVTGRNHVNKCRTARRGYDRATAART